MTDQNSITPPPDLIGRWEEDWHHSKVKHIELEDHIATQAAQWGADQELEACVNWLDDTDCEDPQEVAQRLRAARRPKPPSLKEQALEEFNHLMGELIGTERYKNRISIVRRALEQLDD